MKHARILAILATAAFLTGASANVVFALESNSSAPTAPITPTTAPTIQASTMPAPVTAPAPAAASGIDQIRNAPDPSSAVDAYTRAQAAAPGNLDVEKAYVHRMVERNAPEMADAQARDVVARDPSDGVAQAVVGYIAAAHGQSGQAAQQLEVAVRLAPTDPFVMRTAAQVVAWYDTQPDRSQLTPRDVQAIEALRAAGANNQVYADAFGIAMQLQRGRQLQQQQQQAAVTSGPKTVVNPYFVPTTQSSTTQPASPASPYVYTYPYPASSYEYAAPAVTASTPYQPSQTYIYNNDYYYPDPYAYSPWYPEPWGWGGGIIVGDFFFVHHDRFFDHDGHFHDGRFDHGGRFDHDGRFDGRFNGPGIGFRPGGIERGGGGGFTTVRPSAPNASPPMRGGGMGAMGGGRGFGGGERGGGGGGGGGGHGGR